MGVPNIAWLSPFAGLETFRTWCATAPVPSGGRWVSRFESTELYGQIEGKVGVPARAIRKEWVSRFEIKLQVANQEKSGCPSLGKRWASRWGHDHIDQIEQKLGVPNIARECTNPIGQKVDVPVQVRKRWVPQSGFFSNDGCPRSTRHLPVPPVPKKEPHPHFWRPGRSEVGAVLGMRVYRYGVAKSDGVGHTSRREPRFTDGIL